MKKLLLYLMISAILILGACNTGTNAEHEFQMNLLLAMQNTYGSFQELVHESKIKDVDEEVYNKLQNMWTTSKSFKSYQLITFDNGKMVLVQITPSDNKNRYLISDVIFIPDEFAEVFKTH